MKIWFEWKFRQILDDNNDRAGISSEEEYDQYLEEIKAVKNDAN